MDRRVAVMGAVCLIEAAFRLIAGHVPVDGLSWTLLARLVQGGVILAFALAHCGVIAASIPRETAVGLWASAAFGGVVLLVDLASRFFLEGGVLGLLLARHPLDRWLPYAVTACLVGPFVEELFFRGLLYARIRERLPAWACIALTSVLFASLHGGVSVVQLAGGVLFAVLYEWRGNIWPGFVLHAAANAGMWVLPHVHPLV